MYVKIITEGGKREAVHECSDYTFRYYGDEIFLLLNHHRSGGHGENIQLDLVNGTEVYILNNDGKTIDHYNWLKEKAE